MQHPTKFFLFTLLALLVTSVVLPTVSHARPPCSSCETVSDPELCWEICVSPIVINLEPGPLRLTGVEDPVLFDINADGELETLSWTDPDSPVGLLALDRNGNGQVDDGSELFGDHTPQPALGGVPNGFAALAFYDRGEAGGNEDGWISAQDAVFPLLRIWVDGDHDGVSQPFELKSLAAWQIRAVSVLCVDTQRQDPHGNWLRWSSMVDFDGSKRLAATDVFFIRVE